MLKEFKKFISRGNVLDMAVGIIMGSAFTAIVTSLVNDILTPLIGLIIGGLDFGGLAITIGMLQSPMVHLFRRLSTSYLWHFHCF